MKEIEKIYCKFRQYVLYVVALLAIPLAVTLFAFPAYAEDNAELFVSRCGSCHREGSVAGRVNPADKAASVWGRYFKRLNRRHPINISMISDVDIQKIKVYLIEHAADSSKPYANMAVIPK